MEFTDILKCHDLSKRVPDDLTAHLFILGMSIGAYRKSVKTIKEIESITTVISKIRKS